MGGRGGELERGNQYAVFAALIYSELNIEGFCQLLCRAIYGFLNAGIQVEEHTRGRWIQNAFRQGLVGAEEMETLAQEDIIAMVSLGVKMGETCSLLQEKPA